MARYVYTCPECEEELVREFPMGKAPALLESYCSTTGKDVQCSRRFAPLYINYKGEGWTGAHREDR